MITCPNTSFRRQFRVVDGLKALAERARRELLAAGETVRNGEDAAQRMRLRSIPLARQPEEDAGLQVDATDAISADRQARLLNVVRRDDADLRRDVSRALDASDCRVGNSRLRGEAGDDNQAIAGTVRHVAAEAGAQPAQVALAWVYAQAGRLGVPSCPSPAPGIPGGWRSTWPRSACASMPPLSPGATLSPTLQSATATALRASAGQADRPDLAGARIQK